MYLAPEFFIITTWFRRVKYLRHASLLIMFFFLWGFWKSLPWYIFLQELPKIGGYMWHCEYEMIEVLYHTKIELTSWLSWWYLHLFPCMNILKTRQPSGCMSTWRFTPEFHPSLLPQLGFIPCGVHMLPKKVRIWLNNLFTKLRYQLCLM